MIYRLSIFCLTGFDKWFIDIRYVREVDHVETNVVVRGAADHVRAAENTHRRELGGWRGHPRVAAPVAEQGMDHERFQTLAFA